MKNQAATLSGHLISKIITWLILINPFSEINRINAKGYNFSFLLHYLMRQGIYLVNLSIGFGAWFTRYSMSELTDVPLSKNLAQFVN